MNKEVFYQVTSGEKTLPVYDVDAHRRIATASANLDGLLGKVEELSGKHEEHAADDVIHVSQNDRDRWDEVTQMVYSSAFENYQQDVAQEFENTSAWANETFQPVGEYATTAQVAALEEDVANINEDLDEIADILADKVDVSAASAWDIDPYVGDDTFIKVQGHEISFIGTIPTIPGISGESGVSARYDTNAKKYVVGLERYENAGFAKFETSSNAFTTSAAFDGYSENQNLNPSKIKLSADTIYLQPGLYHIDTQITLQVTGGENQYYETKVKSLGGNCEDLKAVDASYEHIESVDLSYDMCVTNADTPLITTIEGFQPGGTAAISNINIHEILQMPSRINGGAGSYEAGAGIRITNDLLSVNYGDGLWIHPTSNKLEIKLGNGLKFSNDGDVEASLVIDDTTQAVVETVKQLEEDLDTKVTTNMSMSEIANVWHREYWTGVAAGDGQAMMLAQLFAVPIKHKLYASAADAKYISNVGIYTHQSFGGKVIFSIYEFKFDGHGGGGDTSWIADTGPVSWDSVGRHEFPLLHVREGAELKAENMYYASMTIMGADKDNLWLAGTTTGYNQAFNSSPKITFNVDNIPVTGDLSFSSSAGTTSGVSRGTYSENAYRNPRFFMQIRNKKV